MDIQNRYECSKARINLAAGEGGINTDMGTSKLHSAGRQPEASSPIMPDVEHEIMCMTNRVKLLPQATSLSGSGPRRQPGLLVIQYWCAPMGRYTRSSKEAS